MTNKYFEKVAERKAVIKGGRYGGVHDGGFNNEYEHVTAIGKEQFVHAEDGSVQYTPEAQRRADRLQKAYKLTDKKIAVRKQVRNLTRVTPKKIAIGGALLYGGAIAKHFYDKSKGQEKKASEVNKYLVKLASNIQMGSWVGDYDLSKEELDDASKEYQVKPLPYEAKERAKAVKHGLKNGALYGTVAAGLGYKFGGPAGATLGAALGGGVGLLSYASKRDTLNQRVNYSHATRILDSALQKKYGTSDSEEILEHILTKKAFEFKNQHTKDVVDTGVIAGLGGVGNMVSNRILGHKEAFNPKSFAVGAGIGLVADYAGLKINKALGHVQNKKETNVPL